jgi:uncharacterized membrane protein YedE/YeeE
MNTNKTFYWIATIVCCGIMAFSASMYFTKTDMIKQYFEMMHYPSYIVIPLAIAKVLGIVAILTRWSPMLTDWAYAGFFFDGVLATAAHVNNGDPFPWMAVAVCVAVVVSRWYGDRAYPRG